MLSVSFYSSSSGSITFSDQKYIEVYPSAFTTMSFKSLNPGSASLNPIEVKVKPSSSLTTSNYLVIEIPTDTNGGSYFADDIGLGITYDNQQITIDEISNNYLCKNF